MKNMTQTEGEIKAECSEPFSPSFGGLNASNKQI